MKLAAFEPMNLRSEKVRIFFVLLGFVLIGYAIGSALYWTRPVPARAMDLAVRSYSFLALAVMTFLFFVVLRWHILRTTILALSLLGLSSLYCALVLVLFESRVLHAAGLFAFGVLFIWLIVTQSNFIIYVRDRTYDDAALEGVIACTFVVLLLQMIFEALGMG